MRDECALRSPRGPEVAVRHEERGDVPVEAQGPPRAPAHVAVVEELVTRKKNREDLRKVRT